jgi:hypothetical protein
MISREEFNHQLQTGRVREALASVVQSLNELEITTQIAVDRQDNLTDRPYLRTKIDLFSGRVIDEVSANFTDARDRDRLQQLHAERVVTSYDLARDYLDRIHNVLGAMPEPVPSERPIVTHTKSPTPALVAKLQQARASLTSRLSGDANPTILFPDRTLDPVTTTVEEIELVEFSNEIDELAIVLKTPPTSVQGLTDDELSAVTTIVDEEIDLAIALSADYADEENGEAWAGWVEEEIADEEYDLEAISPQPPANPTLLDWQEIPTPRYVDAIEVKPIVNRSIDRSVDPISQWDTFEPDYLGIDFDPHPATTHPHIDRRASEC